MHLYRARWLLPIAGPPVEGGGVLVSGETIRAVGPSDVLAKHWPVARRTELPECALVPALVNGHAHLELSALSVPPFHTDFVSWLLHVIESKRSVVDEGVWERGVAEGVAACARGGQGTIADVLSVPRAAASYPSAGPRVCAYPEVIAPRKAALHSGMERAKAAAAAVGGNGRVWGLSPHAPYTVCAEAFRQCREVVQRHGWRLMIHLAESREELEFLRGERGAMVDRLYASLPSSPPPSPRLQAVDLLRDQQVFTVPTILIHAVHLGSEREISVLRAGGAGVVLCPRSNRNLGVGVAPGRSLLDAGVPVGLGTDSILSAGTLDLWDDVRAAVDDYRWTPREALTAATVGSARVHGIADRVGSLEAGKSADLVAIEVGAGRDPWEAVLRSTRVCGVWLAGRLYG